MKQQVLSYGSAIKSIIASVKQYPFLCLGYCLYWIWVVITLQGPIRFPLHTTLGFPLPSWCVVLLVSVLVYIAIALAPIRYEQFTSRRRLSYRIMCGTMFAGLIASTLWVVMSGESTWADSPITLALYLVGSLLMGTGSSMILVEFCRLYARLGNRIMLYHGIIAMLAAMLYQFAIISFGFFAINMILNPIFPLIIYACFVQTIPRMNLAPPVQTENRKGYAILPKVLITTGIQGLGFGIGLGLLLEWEIYTAEPRFIGSLCSGAAALIIFITVFQMKANFTSMVYLVGLPLMAFGFLVMACSPTLISLGNAIQAVGSCYQYIVILCLVVYLSRTQHLPLIRICGFSMASLYIGQVVGGCLGSLLASGSLIRVPLTTIASIMCALLLTAALYISNSNRKSLGWEVAQPGSNEDGIESRIRSIAAKSGLTTRQEEIVALLVQGYNKTAIARDLQISEETAKTHIRNIYTKIGIHSQQALIELIRKGEE